MSQLKPLCTTPGPLSVVKHNWADTVALISAAPDMETALSYVWNEIESGKARVTTATMLLIREALMKAGHDELRVEPHRTFRITGDV